MSYSGCNSWIALLSRGNLDEWSGESEASEDEGNFSLLIVVYTPAYYLWTAKIYGSKNMHSTKGEILLWTHRLGPTSVRDL